MNESRAGRTATMNFRQDYAWNSGGDWVMHVALGPIWFGGAAILGLSLGIFLDGVTDVYERYKPLLRGQTFILVEGEVQQGSGALSVLVSRALETPVLSKAADGIA